MHATHTHMSARPKGPFLSSRIWPPLSINRKRLPGARVLGKIARARPDRWEAEAEAADDEMRF